MLLLHQQSHNNQTLKIAARLSLPAQVLSFASPQGCSGGVHTEQPCALLSSRLWCC